MIETNLKTADEQQQQSPQQTEGSVENRSSDETDKRHVEIIEDIETVYIDVEMENDRDKYARRPWFHSEDVPWDELEMKAHGLRDRESRRTDKSTTDEKPPARASSDETGDTSSKMYGNSSCSFRVPFDEVAMKQNGFLNTHCRRMTEAEFNEKLVVRDDCHVDLSQCLEKDSSASSDTDANANGKQKSRVVNPSPKSKLKA